MEKDSGKTGVPKRASRGRRMIAMEKEKKWLKIGKYIVKRIHPWVIFKDIMSSFIASCGLAFLIIFFEWDAESMITKENLMTLARNIYILIFPILIFANIALQRPRWFGEWPCTTISIIKHQNGPIEVEIAETEEWQNQKKG